MGTVSGLGAGGLFGFFLLLMLSMIMRFARRWLEHRFDYDVHG